MAEESSHRCGGLGVGTDTAMWPWPFTSRSERIYPRGAGPGGGQPPSPIALRCSDMTPHRGLTLRGGGGGGGGEV